MRLDAVPLLVLTSLLVLRFLLVKADMSNGQVISSQYPSSNTFSFGSFIKLYWKLWKNTKSTSNPVIEFGMICKQAGYCSLGFNHASGQGMSNIDTVFATMTNGIPTVLDAYCQSKRTIPVADTDIGGTNDFLEYNGGIYNSEYHYKWTRYVTTSDTTADKVIPSSSILVSWAYHTSSNSLTARHTDYGSDDSINFQYVAATENYIISSNKTIGNANNTASSTNTYMSHLYHLYALGIAVFIVVAIGMVCTIIPQLFSPNGLTNLFLYRKFSKLVPGHRFASSYVNQFLDMTIGEFSIIVIFLALNIIWFVFGYLSDTAKGFGTGFSKLIILSWIFVIIPVTRYSVINAIFGISFERSLKFHKWLGAWLFAACTLHGAAEVIYYRSQFLYLVSLDTDMYPLLGIIAWGAMVVLLLLSFEPIRRRFWEVFYYTHLPLAIIVVAFSVAHGEGYINLLPYMGASFALFGIDLVLRLIIGFGIPTKVVSITHNKPSEVTTCVFRKRMLTFFQNPLHANYLFVYIPKVSIYQFHPFTISSCIKDDVTGEYEFTCHVKNNNKGWCAKLAKVAETASPEDYSGVRVEGAYGSLSVPLLQHDVIVLIAGGIGITPIYALLQSIFQKPHTQVYCCWSVKGTEMIGLFPKLLEPNPNINSVIYVTSKPKQTTDVVSSFKNDNQLEDDRIVQGSRPNFVSYLQQIKKETSCPYIGVMVCGPYPMITSVHNAVWDCSDSDTKFQLHKEEFEF